MEPQNASTDFSMQNIFWNKLQQFKFDLIYYSLHFSRCTFFIRAIKYISAGGTVVVTSIWLNWKEINTVSLICAIIIIALQALSAVSELFPFENRKQEIREMTDELDALYIIMEDDWRKITNGEYSVDEIMELIKKYENEQAQIKRHYFKDDSLPEISKIIDSATEKTTDYFKNFI